MDNGIIAIHEAAHAVFAHMLGTPTKKLYLYESAYQNKLGEMVPIIDRQYDILSIDLTAYSNPEIQSKTIKATKSMLFILIAGNVAEKYFQKQHPDFPPDLREGADGYYCYLIIEKLCQFHKRSFSQTKFNQVYFALMDAVYSKIKSDKNLCEMIEVIAKKLEKSNKGYIGFWTISFSIAFMLIWKIIIHKYRPQPFLDFDLITEIEK